MNNFFHKIATYTALILVSSLPLSMDVLEDATKQSAFFRFSSVDENNRDQNKYMTDKNKN